MRPNPCLKESLRVTARIYRIQFRNPAKSHLLKLFGTFSLALKLPQLHLETISAQASSSFPSIQNRHGTMRQFRAPAIPFRLATHGCIATSTSRFHDTILSCPLNFIEPCRSTKLLTHFVPRLTRLPICGKLNVYAAWFLRGCSVTGESCPPRPRREATGLSCRYKPKWIQSSYVIFVLLRTSTTANPRSPTACSK